LGRAYLIAFSGSGVAVLFRDGQYQGTARLVTSASISLVGATNSAQKHWLFFVEKKHNLGTGLLIGNRLAETTVAIERCWGNPSAFVYQVTWLRNAASTCTCAGSCKGIAIASITLSAPLWGKGTLLTVA
jgi:hypothetical protein